MRPALFRPRRLVPLLILLLAAVFGRSRAVATKPAGQTPTPSTSFADGAPSGPSSAPSTAASAKSGTGLDLGAIGDPHHRAQVARVVEAMDRTGAPPDGVAQGGRRGARKGVFQNAEGRLPRKALGYWIESDVWPRKGPRDAERLIFGREREVYWTRDHYESFFRLR
jgi:guanyl-specific ribonuclease Sa